MAFTVTPQILDLNATRLVSTAVGATLEPNLTGGSCLLHTIRVTNAHANAAVLKIWDGDGSAVTVGTTAPDFVLPCPGSDTVTYAFTDTASMGGGVPLDGLSVACVKNVGVSDGPGTEGTTAPTGNVGVTILTTPT